jgi:catechol 2,3-dioxygenase-like lactoylglutathione lyase family enzyme
VSQVAEPIVMPFRDRTTREVHPATLAECVDLCPGIAMEARITLITLGVDDLEKAVVFYRDGLGLATKGIVGTQFAHGAVAFFELQAGLKLALWPRASIAHDTGLARSDTSPTDLTLAHNVRSKDEVDAVMAQAAQAGARIVKAAVPTFYGGYAGYFQDPDGHLWEVAWNPEFQV